MAFRLFLFFFYCLFFNPLKDATRGFGLIGVESVVNFNICVSGYSAPEDIISLWRGCFIVLCVAWVSDHCCDMILATAAERLASWCST